MQQAYGQSWYHSATAVAAYFRRMGQEPTPYQIAAVLTATPAGHFNPYYAADPTLYPTGKVEDADDDDDDDDDDNFPQIAHYPYAMPFPHLINKNGIQMPFHNPAFTPGYQLAPQPHFAGMPQVPFPTAVPNATSQNNARPATTNGKMSREGITRSQRKPSGPASVAVATSGPMDVDAAHVRGSSSLTPTVAASKRGQNMKEKSMESDPEPTAASGKNDDKKMETRREAEPRQETRSPENGEILPGAASSELESFSVADFPEKGQKGPDEGDEGSSDGENLVGNAWGMAPRVFGAQTTEDNRPFSVTDLV